ncbi:hypothetical protein BJ508DRAFT_412937 [Ascobolus immersus RN42]|uniref:Uncharacterized protein n=1 Tax=Ascobolus immersus RN42 TaxID=1160509 RepID=A0A3N4IHS7_ASCIM|nr:hypothetical protein BJ508DRAFT_412937 [Ascobolus immersus RN42]
MVSPPASTSSNPRRQSSILVPALQLSLLIEGVGISHDTPSHWAFALHSANSTTCTLLNVLVLDDSIPQARRVYGLDRRDGHEMINNDSQGRLLLAPDLTAIQYKKASEVIEAEPAPLNAKGEGENCQNWCLNALVDLEVEELVEAGLSEWLGSLVGKSAQFVKEEGEKKGLWVDVPPHPTDKVFVHKFLS